MLYIYVIISLFLFLREFTRVKWSENENEFYFLESRERREFGAIRYFKESIMNRLVNSKQIREWADKQGLII
jgi:hypothetical protein